MRSARFTIEAFDMCPRRTPRHHGSAPPLSITSCACSVANSSPWRLASDALGAPCPCPRSAPVPTRGARGIAAWRHVVDAVGCTIWSATPDAAPGPGMVAQRITREAAMAKLLPRAGAGRNRQGVQIHGGAASDAGTLSNRLYREIRALRIYEGASEVPEVIIARQTLSGG